MNKRIWAVLLGLVLMMISVSALADYGVSEESMTVTYTLTANTYAENLFTYDLTFPAVLRLERSKYNAPEGVSDEYAVGSCEFGLTNIRAGKSALANELTCPWVKFRVTPPTQLTCGDKVIDNFSFDKSFSSAPGNTETMTESYLDIEYNANHFRALGLAHGGNPGKLTTTIKIQAWFDEDGENAPEYGDMFTGYMTYYGVCVR